MSGRKPFEDALDHIFWCDVCNVPLITDACGACGGKGRAVALSPPGDVRFCSVYERTLIRKLFQEGYGADPIGDRLVLLNKIPGDDKADEVILDGRTIAVVAYDLSTSGYTLDLRIDGAKLLMPVATKKLAIIDVPREKHLNGKGISGASVVECSNDITGGDVILLKVSDSFNGFGVARTDASNLKNPADNTIKVRKISSSRVQQHASITTMADVKALLKMNVNAALGMAIYTGRLNLDELSKLNP